MAAEGGQHHHGGRVILPAQTGENAQPVQFRQHQIHHQNVRRELLAHTQRLRAVITKGDNDTIHTLEDLNGKKTANTISSTYAQLAEQYGAEVTGVDDLNQTFELLNSGRIDATLNAEVTFYDYTKEHPDANVKIAVLTQDANEVAIPLRKGEESATLREAINAAIDELRASGQLKELSEKYFGTDISTNE